MPLRGYLSRFTNDRGSRPRHPEPLHVYRPAQTTSRSRTIAAVIEELCPRWDNPCIRRNQVGLLLADVHDRTWVYPGGIRTVSRARLARVGGSHRKSTRMGTEASGRVCWVVKRTGRYVAGSTQMIVTVVAGVLFSPSRECCTETSLSALTLSTCCMPSDLSAPQVRSWWSPAAISGYVPQVGGREKPQPFSRGLGPRYVCLDHDLWSW